MVLFKAGVTGGGNSREVVRRTNAYLKEVVGGTDVGLKGENYVALDPFLSPKNHRRGKKNKVVSKTPHMGLTRKMKHL